MDATSADNDRIPVVEVIVTHALNVESVPQLTATFAEVLRVHPVQLVIDLAACPAIDAAGIAALLDAHRRVRRDGGHLTLRAPSERLRRNLALSRTDRVLRVVASGV